MSQRVYRYRQSNRSSDPSIRRRNTNLQSLRDSILDQIGSLGLQVDDDGLLSDLDDFDENELFAILGLFGLLGYFSLLAFLSLRNNDDC